MRAVDDKRPSPAIPDRLNLAGHVLWAAGASDDKVALVLLRATGAERWRYGRLREAVMRTAGGLRAAGLTPGARVLMRIGNTPDFPVTYLGAIAAGLVAVPTAAALGAEEITKVARILSPDAIVSDGTVPMPDHDAPVLSPAALARAEPLERPAETGANDPAYIVFTSGTSGMPSGVVHAHRAILARGLMTGGWYGLTPSDRVLHAGAFNWTFTLGTGLMDPWAAGATALVLAPGTGPEMIPLLAQRHEATMIAGAPGVFRRLLKVGMPALPRLRHGLVAGEKLPETVRAAWRDATGTELHEAFGQSEISTFISGSPARPAPEGTLGYTQGGRCVAILTEDGSPAERGEDGAIAIHGSDPGLMLGTLDGPLAVRLTGEWFTTGDRGLMREDGAVEYHGRTDDILTAGGFRVSPIEVEAAMQRHPGIEEAAAVDCHVTPETTVIAVHYTGPAALPEAELAAHAEAHLARYKQPRLFVHAQSLPRNANGKLLRRRLPPANETAP